MMMVRVRVDQGKGVEDAEIESSGQLIYRRSVFVVQLQVRIVV
jgi:hypothetical protein